jgi:hypothetical protein
MAKADDYAKWIVDNQGKKGTSDFDTVVNAYQLAKKEESFDSKDLVSQIPGQEARFAVPPAPPEKMAGEPKFLERAAMYAGGIPVAAGLARGAQLASAGTRAAPYVGRLAEAVIPKTGTELAKMGGTAAALSVPAEYLRSSAEQRGAGPGGQAVAEMVGGLGAGALASIPAAGRSAYQAIEPARKRGVQSLADLLKTGVGKDVERYLAAQQAEKSAAEAALAKRQPALEQIAQQQTVAEQRAKTAPEFVGQKGQEGPLRIQKGLTAEEQAGARQRAADIKVAEENRLAQAQRQVESREAGLAGAQQAEQQATQAADALERSLSGRQGIDAETFGGRLRSVAKKLKDDLSKLRKDESKYQAAFQSAGDVPSISTTEQISNIDSLSKNVRNPTLQRILSVVKSELMTGKDKALNLRSADSLKKFLDSVIQTRQMGDMSVDKEAVSVLKQIRGQLIKNAVGTHPEYGKAMTAFRTASRPLDIVERNGALRKILDIDPLSSDYFLTEAQVVGKILEKVNAGNKVFGRLLEQDPGIKDAARLYFTRSLFGADQAPSEAVLRNWIVKNERALRQTGLFDEFKTIERARRAAQQAVSEAKGEISVAKGAVSEAEAAKTEAEKAAKRALDVSKKSESRLQAALKTGETAEQLAARAATQAKPSIQKLEKAVSDLQKTVDTKEDAINALDKIRTNITLAKTPKDVASVLEATANSLRSKGFISEPERLEILKTSQNLGNVIEAREKAARSLYVTMSKMLGYGGFFGTGIYGIKKAFD